MFGKQTLAVLVSLPLLASVACAAPERTGHWDLGVQVSGAIPRDGDLDAAAQVVGSLAYGFNEWLAIGFSGGWQRHGSDDATADGITIPGPDITGVPLFGDIILRVPTGQEPFTPYGVVGLGVVIWDVDKVTASVGGIPVAVTTDVDTEFAVKLGGGVDWFLNDNWIINFEAAYVFSDPKATVTATALGTSASASEDIKLGYWTVGGGVKYRF